MGGILSLTALARREQTPDNPSGLQGEAWIGLISDMSSFKGVYDGIAFSVATSYVSGDVVIYLGELYKFNQSHTPAAWNATHADLVANGEVRINGTHTFISLGFYKCFINEQDAKAVKENMGSRYKRGGKVSVTIEHPDGGPAASAFFNRIQGKPICLLVKTPDALVIQVGLPGSPAELEHTFDTGTREAPGSAHGAVITAYHTSVVYYEGTITPAP